MPKQTQFAPVVDSIRIPDARCGDDPIGSDNPVPAADSIADTTPVDAQEMTTDPDDDDDDPDENEEYPPTLLCGGDDDPGASLDDDPDTSLATSLQLHLMSEHGLANGTHLSDEDAAALHDPLHTLERRHTHDVTDHRFRPGLVLDLIRAAVEREHELTQALAAVGVEVISDPTT